MRRSPAAAAIAVLLLSSVPGSAMARDLRPCQLVDDVGEESVVIGIPIGPNAKDVLVERWRYSVVMEKGRLVTLLAEAEPGSRWQPSAYGFEPAPTEAVSFLQRLDLGPDKKPYSTVQRAEVKAGGTVVVERWRAWHDGTKATTAHGRLTLQCSG